MDFIQKITFILPRSYLFSRFDFKFSSKILATSKIIIIARVFLLHTQKRQL